MPSPARRLSLDHVTWTLLAAMLLACVGFAWSKGFHIEWLHAIAPGSAIAGLVVAQHIGRQRARLRLTAAATAFLQTSLFTVTGVVLAYTIAAHPAALWDVRLAAIDEALGLRWPLILAALDRAPLVVLVLGIAYHSLGVQMIVVIAALSLTGKFDTLRVTVAAAILSGFVIILISAVMPAAGNLFDPSRYHHLWPSIAWQERDLIAGLRNGPLRSLDLSSLMGIVSFPSYHATLAAIFIWCSRALPKLRTPMAVWAVLTVFATPVFGGHYVIEVVTGLFFAPPAIVLASALNRRLTCSARAPAGPGRTAEPIHLATSRTMFGEECDGTRTVLKAGHELA